MIGRNPASRVALPCDTPTDASTSGHCGMSSALRFQRLRSEALILESSGYSIPAVYRESCQLPFRSVPKPLHGRTESVFMAVQSTSTKPDLCACRPAPAHKRSNSRIKADFLFKSI